MNVESRVREGLRPIAVLARALDILRRHLGRVVVGGLACLTAPAVAAAVLAELVLGDELPVLVAALVGFAMTAVAAGGLVVFVGYLDLIVHADRHGHVPGTLGEVAPRLPILRLLAADAVLAVLFAVGSALLVVPGLIALTWYCLVGSMIVTGGATSVWDGFARARWIVRGHFWLVFFMVTVPLVLEHDVVLAAEHVIESRSDNGAVAVAIVIAVLVNMAVALVEVVLAQDLRERSSLGGAAPQ